MSDENKRWKKYNFAKINFTVSQEVKEEFKKLLEETQMTAIEWFKKALAERFGTEQETDKLEPKPEEPEEPKLELEEQEPEKPKKEPAEEPKKTKKIYTDEIVKQWVKMYEEYGSYAEVGRQYAKLIGAKKEIDKGTITKKIKDWKKEQEEKAKKFKWPVPGFHRITSPFGLRTMNGEERMHNGTDIGSNFSPSEPIEGANVLAIADGQVTRVTLNPTAGNWIIIDHKDGYQSEYMHNAANLVIVGDVVKQGDLIAQVGRTGNATGPHLHLGMMLNGRHVDPMQYLETN